MSIAPLERRDSVVSSSDTSLVVIEWDEEERRSFNFFINKTAPELAGNFESKFWTGLVLQRCHSDPPIRHAVIALGAFNESFKFGDIKLLEAGAIVDQKQRDWMERNEQNPLAHPESSANWEFIRSELVPLFRAVDIQAIRILPTSFIQWEMASGLTKFDFKPQTSIPDPISSLNEAKHHLQNQTRAILIYHQNAAQYYSPEMRNNDDTLRSRSMNAIVEEKRERVLQLEQWSQVFNNFAQAAAESLLKSYGDSRLENGRVFSFDTAIIPPLLCVACKCRDPSLRRKAHALLVSSFKREGSWDSEFASSIGRWTIDKEEKGLENISRAEEVVESSRIAVTEITSHGRRKALIKFRQGTLQDYGKLQEEWIVW
ncbi:Transcriptional regulatory protein moc3-like protein 11 [Botrytis cinerea]